MSPATETQTTRVLAEIQAGGGLSLSRAAIRFPGRCDNQFVHASSILRWIVTGARSGDRLIKLEAARCGSRWITSAAALERFVGALTAAEMAEK